MGKQVSCAVCSCRFDVDADLEIGDTLDCPSCAANLRLSKLNPAEVEEVLDSWGDYGDDENEE